MTTEERQPGRSRFRTAAQVFGWVGLVACAVLAVGVLFGHGWASGRVNETFDDIDAVLDRGTTVVNLASGRLQERVADIDSFLTEASSVASNASLPPVLAAKAATIADRYGQIRDEYVAVRARIGAALQSLEQVARFLPFIEVPQEPTDALAALDERVTQFDANLSALRADASSTVDRVIAAITTLRAAVDGIDQVTERIETGISDVRERVDQANGRIDTYLWIGTGALLAILAYIAILNILVIRLARR